MLWGKVRETNPCFSPIHTGLPSQFDTVFSASVLCSFSQTFRVTFISTAVFRIAFGGSQHSITLFYLNWSYKKKKSITALNHGAEPRFMV